MHILVTGGCGYIGSCLVPELLEQRHRVTVVDTQWFGNCLAEHENLNVIHSDIRDIDAVPVKGVETIIHLANIANDPCGELDAKLAWEVNVLGTMQLVDKAVRHGVGQFIYASSGSVYGVSEAERVIEDLPLVPISDYNKTKMISERVLMSYKDQITIQCIRPATVCGYSPRQRLDVAVNLLTNLALNRGNITVFGGEQTRPNIHMSDMVGVYLHFLGRDDLPGIYNAGFENMSIMDIARMVTMQVPSEVEVQESNDPRSYRQDSERLLATGFMPKYGVEDGIRDMVKAFQTGKVTDHDNCYNIRTMKHLIEQGGLAHV